METNNFVRFRILPSGGTVGLFVEDLIGRASRCELQINDPKISEFHAALSFRNGRMVLLGLRGALFSSGTLQREVVLQQYTQITLSPGCSLVVEELGRFDATEGVLVTEQHSLACPPLRIVCRYATVQFHMRNAPPRVLAGNYARIIWELASREAPMRWEHLAEQIWTNKDRRGLSWLRDRYDRTTARLRRALLREGLPPDLIRRTDGEIELVKRDCDKLLVEEG